MGLVKDPDVARASRTMEAKYTMVKIDSAAVECAAGINDATNDIEFQRGFLPMKLDIGPANRTDSLAQSYFRSIHKPGSGVRPAGRSRFGNRFNQSGVKILTARILMAVDRQNVLAGPQRMIDFSQ